jgi:Outer membrane protein beta-barrel domain
VRFRTLASLFIVLAVVLAIPSLSAAQVPATEFGVKAGFNISNIKLDADDADLTSDGRAGFLFGLWIARDFNPRAGIQVEGLFSQKGAEFATEDGVFEDNQDASFKLTYVEFPVLARVNFPAGGATARVLVGPTFAFHVNETIKSGGVELDGDDVPLKTFEMGFALGGAVDIRRFVIDARYTWGLTDINDSDDSDDFTVKNNTFSLSFGWRF